jgi:hypothetical protein
VSRAGRKYLGCLTLENSHKLSLFLSFSLSLALSDDTQPDVQWRSKQLLSRRDLGERMVFTIFSHLVALHYI